jgi:DNA mismatch endonuclease (patch repair protein)
MDASQKKVTVPKSRKENIDSSRRKRRSELMSQIKSKNTGPEVRVRSLLHGLGFRFRLHCRSLPGTPDIAMPYLKTAILVHGCFWHGHECSRGALPNTNQAFWKQKIERNRTRDLRVVSELRKLGWHPITVWQCELRDILSLTTRLMAELPARSSASVRSPNEARAPSAKKGSRTPKGRRNA